MQGEQISLLLRYFQPARSLTAGQNAYAKAGEAEHALPPIYGRDENLGPCFRELV